MTRVFVYGTLMRGEANHRYVARESFVRADGTISAQVARQLDSATLATGMAAAAAG